MGEQLQSESVQVGSHIAKLIERNRAQHVGAFLYEDVEWMRAAYVDRRLTLREMAAEADCGLRTVARWMQIHGIPTDPDRKPRQTRSKKVYTCRDCGAPCSRGRGNSRCMACYDRSGANNYRWLGDQASYESAHDRVKSARGKATQYACAHCLNPAAEWAYDHTDPDERPAGTSGPGEKPHGPYSFDVERYLPLCVSCHRRFDRPRKLPDHGKHWRYQQGCRCVECRAANAAAGRRYRERRAQADARAKGSAEA